MSTSVGLLLFAVLGLLAFSTYMLPALIAGFRHHNNRMAIMVLNFFTGWTFLGWVASMVWAFTSNVAPKEYEATSGGFITGSR